MGSHRRFVSSETRDEYATGLQPEHALESYGAVRMGARPNYGITTDPYRESQDPTVAGWVDWLFGGFEDEDAKASTAKNLSTDAMVNQMNEDRRKADDPLSRLVNELPGGKVPPPGPDWKKLALVVGGIGGAYLLWAKVIEPRIAKKVA